MKALLKGIIYFAVLLVLISSCKLESSVQPYPILNENTCNFPCWMGITPGETPYNEVMKKLDILVQEYTNKGLTITIQEAPNTGSQMSRYIYVELPGSEIYITRKSETVDKIKIYFTNTPSLSDFVKNYKPPKTIGFCWLSYEVRPTLIYDGARVLTKFELPKIDEMMDVITIENFYRNRVDEVRLESKPPNIQFDFNFSWEEMAQTVQVDLKTANPDSNCGEPAFP